MLNLPILIPEAELTALCQHYQVRRLALFGSVLRPDFHSDSDIDILIEFKPDAHIGWEIVTLEDKLSALFGRKVDLNTAGSLSVYFRDDVLRSALVIYERAG